MKKRDKIIKPHTSSESRGVISFDALYTREEAMSRMGWTESAWIAAIEAGLKTHRLGKRTYVMGRALGCLIGKQKPSARLKRKKTNKKRKTARI